MIEHDSNAFEWIDVNPSFNVIFVSFVILLKANAPTDVLFSLVVTDVIWASGGFQGYIVAVLGYISPSLVDVNFVKLEHPDNIEPSYTMLWIG